eukprot:1353361-Amorphochlora_amoeboformis.AAC.1
MLLPGPEFVENEYRVPLNHWKAGRRLAVGFKCSFECSSIAKALAQRASICGYCLTPITQQHGHSRRNIVRLYH